MNRVDGWEEALVAVLERHAALPGAWGVSDCWICACDCFAAVTGEALLPGLRGYRTEKGGYRLFARHGFDNVEAALSSALPEIGRFSAMRGDLVTLDGPNGISCGVVTGHVAMVKTLFADGTAALRQVPMCDVRKVFGAGR